MVPRGWAAHRILGGDRFARLTGVKLIHVPYRGMAPAVNDLVGGGSELLVTSTAPVLGALQAGSVRALASATKSRLPFMAQIPTTAEAGLPGYELTTWFGLMAPNGTPTSVVNRLNTLVGELLADEIQISQTAGRQFPDTDDNERRSVFCLDPCGIRLLATGGSRGGPPTAVDGRRLGGSSRRRYRGVSGSLRLAARMA